MKKKMLSIILAAMMAGTMATGCGADGGKKEENHKNSITVLVESGSPAEALAKETAASFKEETGCEVIIDAVAYTGMYDKLSTEIKAKQAPMTWRVWMWYGWQHLQTQWKPSMMQIPVIFCLHYRKAERLMGIFWGTRCG